MVTQGQIDQVEREIRQAEQEQQRLERALGAPVQGTNVQAVQRELQAAIANTTALRKRKADLTTQMQHEQRLAGRGV